MPAIMRKHVNPLKKTKIESMSIVSIILFEGLPFSCGYICNIILDNRHFFAELSPSYMSVIL